MFTRNIYLFIILLLCFFNQLPLLFGTENTGTSKDSLAWELFTDKGRVFKPLLADPREARVQLGFMGEKGGGKFWDLSFGADLGLFYLEIKKKENFSITVRGLVASRFEFGSKSFDLQDTDFIGGVAHGYRNHNHSFELFLYHQSSHLGDELLSRGERKRIDYSRETLRFLWAYNLDKNLRVYGGPSLHLRADPGEIQSKVILQAGADIKFPLFKIPVYIAVDLQSRQSHNWDVNVSIQLGFDLGDTKKVLKRQRIFIEFFRGFSNMGQFYNERELYVMFGIGFNF